MPLDMVVFDMGPDCLHQCRNLPRHQLSVEFVTAHHHTDWTMLKVETLTTEPTEIQDYNVTEALQTIEFKSEH